MVDELIDRGGTVEVVACDTAKVRGGCCLERRSCWAVYMQSWQLPAM
jgi:hypothetical protein